MYYLHFNRFNPLLNIYIDFSLKVDSDSCDSDHFSMILENDGPGKWVQRWILMEAHWEQFQHLCSACLHQLAITDADDSISFVHFHLDGHCKVYYSSDFAVPKCLKNP